MRTNVFQDAIVRAGTRRTLHCVALKGFWQLTRVSWGSRRIILPRLPIWWKRSSFFIDLQFSIYFDSDASLALPYTLPIKTCSVEILVIIFSWAFIGRTSQDIEYKSQNFTIRAPCSGPVLALQVKLIKMCNTTDYNISCLWWPYFRTPHQIYIYVCIGNILLYLSRHNEN